MPIKWPIGKCTLHPRILVTCKILVELGIAYH